jgi:hypothetical protein
MQRQMAQIGRSRSALPADYPSRSVQPLSTLLSRCAEIDRARPPREPRQS